MRLVLCAMFLAIFARPIGAQVLRPVTVGVTGGTLGIGPEVSYTINPLVAIRGSATFLGGSGHGHSDGYRYSGHARISNWGGTVDIHPFASGFRLSAGARSTAHDRIRFTGTPARDMTFSGMTFTPDQVGSLAGTIRTRSISPIATVGYAHSGLTGITFGIDAGVMFHGKPTVHDFSATGELGTNPAAQAKYAEQQQKVRNAVDDYRYYPVLQLSLGFRF